MYIYGYTRKQAYWDAREVCEIVCEPGVNGKSRRMMSAKTRRGNKKQSTETLTRSHLDRLPQSVQH